MFNNAEPGKLTNWNSIDYKWKSRTVIISGYEMAVVFADGEKAEVGNLIFVVVVLAWLSSV